MLIVMDMEGGLIMISSNKSNEEEYNDHCYKSEPIRCIFFNCRNNHNHNHWDISSKAALEVSLMKITFENI